MSAAGHHRRSVTIKAGPLIARMLDMDMDSGSDSDYADDVRPIAEHQRATPLRHSGQLRDLECTPQQPIKVTISAAGHLRRSARLRLRLGN